MPNLRGPESLQIRPNGVADIALQFPNGQPSLNPFSPELAETILGPIDRIAARVKRDLTSAVASVITGVTGYAKNLPQAFYRTAILSPTMANLADSFTPYVSPKTLLEDRVFSELFPILLPDKDNPVLNFITKENQSPELANQRMGILANSFRNALIGFIPETAHIDGNDRAYQRIFNRFLRGARDLHHDYHLDGFAQTVSMIASDDNAALTAFTELIGRTANELILTTIFKNPEMIAKYPLLTHYLKVNARYIESVPALRDGLIRMEWRRRGNNTDNTEDSHSVNHQFPGGPRLPGNLILTLTTLALAVSACGTRVGNIAGTAVAVAGTQAADSSGSGGGGGALVPVEGVEIVTYVNESGEVITITVESDLQPWYPSDLGPDPNPFTPQPPPTPMPCAANPQFQELWPDLEPYLIDRFGNPNHSLINIFIENCNAVRMSKGVIPKGDGTFEMKNIAYIDLSKIFSNQGKDSRYATPVEQAKLLKKIFATFDGPKILDIGCSDAPEFKLLQGRQHTLFVCFERKTGPQDVYNPLLWAPTPENGLALYFNLSAETLTGIMDGLTNPIDGPAIKAELKDVVFDESWSIAPNPPQTRDYLDWLIFWTKKGGIFHIVLDSDDEALRALRYWNRGPIDTRGLNGMKDFLTGAVDPVSSQPLFAPILSTSPVRPPEFVVTLTRNQLKDMLGVDPDDSFYLEPQRPDPLDPNSEQKYYVIAGRKN